MKMAWSILQYLLISSLVSGIFSAFDLSDHEHENTTHLKNPCPVDLNSPKCECEFVEVGYVVDCDNLTWNELINFARLYGDSSYDNDVFLQLHHFNGDFASDFSDLPENGREKLAKRWKSWSVSGAENVTQLPDLKWATSLDDVHLEGLPLLAPTNGSGVFETLPRQLEQMILDGITLFHLSDEGWTLEGFSNLTHLEIIGYGTMNLAGERQPFGNMSSLTELHIAGGRLTGLSETSLHGLENLRILNLSANGLAALPSGLLRGLLDLEVLDVSYNDLAGIPEAWLDTNMELRHFSARWNDLTTISATLFNATHQLTELDLSENYIHTIPAKLFKNTSKLSLLKFRDNNLAKLVEGDFDHLSSLLELDLGQNLITSLQKRTFRGLNRLQILNLTRNFISEISPDTFRDLHTVEMIDLSGNRLTVLKGGMFTGLRKNLTLLNLSGNKIEQVERSALEGIVAAEIDLKGSALRCTCANIFLKDHLTSSTFCVDPREMTVHNLADLTEHNCVPTVGGFLGSTQEALFFAGSILFLVTIILGVAVICVLSQRVTSGRVFFPSTYYDQENLAGSDYEIKTISTSL